jgi:hypothetical protein
MDCSGPSKRRKNTAVLPNDFLDIIFSKLVFEDKLRCGIGCKQWDEFLKTGTLPAKHGDVPSDLDKAV